jgi:acetyltransferase-like isoleucine patch superfamily enzyme
VGRTPPARKAPGRTWVRLSRFARSLEDRLLRFRGNEARIRSLRARGVRIGENCVIFTTSFSDLPFLVEIGNHVAISGGTSFLTHDGSGWIFEEAAPEIDVFGEIRIGDNCYIGIDCLIFPGTRIGSNCIIGARSVVRGEIPDGSVVMGNPARVVMKTSMFQALLLNHKHRIDTRRFSWAAKVAAVRSHFGLS